MNNEPKAEGEVMRETAPAYGSAWAAAAASGVDMGLLEDSLRMTVWERLQAHQSALELVQMLQGAKLNKRHE